MLNCWLTAPRTCPYTTPYDPSRSRFSGGFSDRSWILRDQNALSGLLQNKGVKRHDFLGGGQRPARLRVVRPCGAVAKAWLTTFSPASESVTARPVAPSRPQSWKARRAGTGGRLTRSVCQRDAGLHSRISRAFSLPSVTRSPGTPEPGFVRRLWAAATLTDWHPRLTPSRRRRLLTPSRRRRLRWPFVLATGASGWALNEVQANGEVVSWTLPGNCVWLPSSDRQADFAEESCGFFFGTALFDVRF